MLKMKLPKCSECSALPSQVLGLLNPGSTALHSNYRQAVIQTTKIDWLIKEKNSSSNNLRFKILQLLENLSLNNYFPL